MRLAILILSVAALATSSARADEPEPPPPQLFLDLGASLGDAGFHLDDRDPDGWAVDSICDRGEKQTACTLMKGSWTSVVVADKRHDGQAVVQELWLFEYATAKDAARAMTSLGEDSAIWPFAKHPYHLFRCEHRVIAIEGRFRWSTARKQLRKHVAAWLDEHCAAEPKRR